MFFIQSKMDLQLHGKRALVTGSTADIGFAITQGPAKEGRTGKGVDEALATLKKTAAAGKLEGLADPEEVANLVTFVCRPLSSATNGAALRADGGVVRSIV